MKNETLDERRFVPVAPYDTPDAVESLCNTYEQASAKEEIDSLILIPTFICDFLCIHPFDDGNGRMSRLLTLLLLNKNGYDVWKYISIEKQIEKTKNQYYSALAALKKLTEEGFIIRKGSGRSTFYVRSDSK